MAKLSKALPIAMGALAVCALALTSASAANLADGKFLIRAQNDVEPDIEAFAGSRGTTEGNPGGPTDPGGEPGESRSFSFSCGVESLDLTPAMFDWSDDNREAAASGGAVKPYPSGGWNYIIPFEDTGAYYEAYSMFEDFGYSVDIYALSSELKPSLALTGFGFDPRGLTNSNGPALVTSIKDPSGNSLLCSYGKAKDGLAHGDSRTDPAFFSSGGASYFAQNGMMVADDTLPAATINAVNKETYWVKNGTSWEAAMVHPRLNWALRDRGEKPGFQEVMPDGNIRDGFYRGAGEGTTVYLDWKMKTASGNLVREDSIAYFTTSSPGGSFSETWAMKKPANRIDGPSVVAYSEDGSILTTEYQWEGMPNELTGNVTQRAYEEAGGTGWIGVYSSGRRDSSFDN